MKIEGIFEGLIVAKTGTGKKGPWKLYNIAVAGKKYGIGFNPVKAAVGDTVSFEAEENDRGYMEADPDSFTVVAKATAQSAASASQAAGHNSGSTNNSIENQVALKCAVEFVLGSQGDAQDVAKAFRVFQGLLQPNVKATVPPKPKPVEEQSQDPADDTPY